MVFEMPAGSGRSLAPRKSTCFTISRFVNLKQVPFCGGVPIRAGLCYGVGTLRFRSKPIAALSILLVLAGVLGGWHAPDDRDEVIPVAHQHADHDARFGTSAAPTAPEHCAFCHWLRTFGDGAPIASQVLAAESAKIVRLGAVAEHVGTATRLALSSRAPPLA